MDAVIDHIRARQLISKGPFARLWWSQAISSFGDWVTLFATFSLAARISGGGRAASLAILVPLVARILPGLIIGVVAGVLADRWDRKKTMIIADFGRAILVVVLVFVGNFRDLFIITFAIEILSLLRQPAREAVVPVLVAPKHLMSANGLNLLAAYGTAPLGSAFFALLAERGSGLFAGFSANPGVALAFAFDAVTFVVSGLIVLTIRVPGHKRPRRSGGRLDPRAPLRDLVDGFRFVAGFGAVRRTVIGMAVGLSGGGALFVLGQPFAEQVLDVGDSGYGLLVTSLGVGAGVGMAAMTLWGRHIVRREPWFAAALLLAGLAVAFAALTKTLWGAGGWVFIGGVGTGVAYVTGFTHLHAAVADELRGRTFAALFAAARSALLVSFGLAGVGAAGLHGLFPGILSSGVRTVILLAGVTIVASGAGALWSVRDQLRGDPLDADSYRALIDASDAISWVRGDRRSREAE